MNELRVFIGYDSREPIAFHVAIHSLMRHASHPISVTPLMQEPLRRAKLYTRERGATESTEFSLTRFLVPYLSNFEGYSLFLDSDILIRDDIWWLMLHALAEPGHAVFCVQHDYVPNSAMKMDGCVQTQYPRKNWSSVMLFNNRMCKNLTPDYVNQATGLDLHRLRWAYHRIGLLPLEWNWLVGEYPLNSEAKLLHYTLGGPWFPEYENCDHADLWKAERELMLGAGVMA